jgi:hypothetical protein
MTESLWTKVIIHKCIHPESIEEWIRHLIKKHYGCSIIWKVVIQAFEVMGDGLAWNIGKGTKVWLGSDPWK